MPSVMSSMMPPGLEALTAADSSALAMLEAAATALPWSEAQYREGLTSGNFGWGWSRRDGDNCRQWLAFALFQQVLDEASLLNIVTHPDWRRRGLARRLLEYALPVLDEQGAAVVFLEVRVGNNDAIALYRDIGFVDCGLRRGYYPALAGGREDALVMRRPAGTTSLPQE